MYRLIGVSALFVAITASAGSAGVSESVFKQQAKERIQTLASTLKGELQSAMRDGGPVTAVEVCHQRAPAIAADLSTDGWQIGRVSLKARHPENRPDDWEAAMLSQFEQDKASGVAVADLVAVSHNSGQSRMMKAIPTQGWCLACHGESLGPEVKAAIEQYYPDDTATGFKAGDIRGAFSVTYQGE